MHDLLYENQRVLDGDHLLQYANTLGLDMSRFLNDMSNHVHVPRIREDFLSGIRSGVNGTPSFYINGIRYNNSWDFDTLFETLTYTIEEADQ